MWLLTCCILSPPHANVERERGFSIDNHLLVIHGYSLKEETLEALRLIRDDIENDGICNVNVTKEMMKLFWKCKESLQCILAGAKVTRKTYKSRYWSKKSPSRTEGVRRCIKLRWKTKGDNQI